MAISTKAIQPYTRQSRRISGLNASPCPAAQANAGGRNFRTGGGKVVGMEGSPAPKRVGITEWDSLEKAEAFFKSKAFTDIPDREKAIKTIRRYAVEVAN
jgi:uncharacterized protein (DUF1330 family)